LTLDQIRKMDQEINLAIFVGVCVKMCGLIILNEEDKRQCQECKARMYRHCLKKRKALHLEQTIIENCRWKGEPL
jgi:hypothetical protein